MKFSAKVVSLGLLAAAVMFAQDRGFDGPGGHERGFGMEMIGPWGGAPVTGSPYTAVEVRSFTQALANGNQIQHQDQTKVYRDSQGRVRTETVMGPETIGRTPFTVITIFDPVAGDSIRLDPQHQTAMVRAVKPHTQQEAAGPRHGAGNQSDVAKEDLGSSLVNGRQAMATRTTHTIPAGSIGNQQAITTTRTVWMSPDLKVPLQIVSEDPRWGTTTVTLTNIVQSEPDAALFQIPAGYTVKTMPAGRGGPGRGSNGGQLTQ